MWFFEGSFRCGPQNLWSSAGTQNSIIFDVRLHWNSVSVVKLATFAI